MKPRTIWLKREEGNYNVCLNGGVHLHGMCSDFEKVTGFTLEEGEKQRVRLVVEPVGKLHRPPPRRMRHGDIGLEPPELRHGIIGSMAGIEIRYGNAIEGGGRNIVDIYRSVRDQLRNRDDADEPLPFAYPLEAREGPVDENGVYEVESVISQEIRSDRQVADVFVQGTGSRSMRIGRHTGGIVYPPRPTGAAEAERIANEGLRNTVVQASAPRLFEWQQEAMQRIMQDAPVYRHYQGTGRIRDNRTVVTTAAPLPGFDINGC